MNDKHFIVRLLNDKHLTVRLSNDKHLTVRFANNKHPTVRFANDKYLHVTNGKHLIVRQITYIMRKDIDTQARKTMAKYRDIVQNYIYEVYICATSRNGAHCMLWLSRSVLFYGMFRETELCQSFCLARTIIFANARARTAGVQRVWCTAQTTPENRTEMRDGSEIFAEQVGLEFFKPHDEQRITQFL